MRGKELTHYLNQIPIHEIGRLLGCNLPRTGSCACPSPSHPDKTPSFQVKKSGLHWKCYTCDRHGGSIDLVMFCLNLDFVAARKWLIDRTGNSQIETRIRKASPPASGQARPVHIPQTDDIEIYEAFLSQCPLSEAGLAYLRGRAFSDSTIAHFRIGQIPEKGNLVQFLADRFGDARCQDAGLLAPPRFGGKSLPTFRPGNIVFPIIENGKIVSLQARKLVVEPGKSKYLFLVGKSPRTYNVDVLSTKARTIGICEGIPDTISAHQLGIAAIGILGVSNALTESQIAQLRGRNVEILLDWDNAGEKKAQNLRKELSLKGIVSVRKSRPNPEIKDLNDYLIKRMRDGTA